MTVAYLLFRIADTFEDAGLHWSRSRRLEALAELAELLRGPTRERAEALTGDWLDKPPTEHGGYLELLAETPPVVGALSGLQPQAAEAIRTHTLRTIAGMGRFVERGAADGTLRLQGMEELKAYCYVVAGIVGEMLTDLFLLSEQSLDAVASHLRARAASFGEGLQLVNILKDSKADADENRHFLPRDVDTGEVFALARRDLRAASQYCRAIQRAGGSDGVLAFTALPVELAWATLERVEERGPGAKLTHPEVFSIIDRVERAIASGETVTTAGR